MAARFVKYMCPVIEALKELGNSGTPSEVFEVIAKRLQLTDADLNEQLPSGSSRFENQVQWAKFYLSKAGYIDSSNRGVWSLTEKGLHDRLTDKDAGRLVHDVNQQLARKRADAGETDGASPDEEPAPTESSIPVPRDYRARLIELIRTLPPPGFERLCQRLLREAGFQNVEITGRSGDGGIDGRGNLQINPLVSIPVVFQSKRYGPNSPVTSSQVRDLRGAMEGRSEKGILITTSSFTADARKEALREGATPIELVDADKLVSMFEKLQLGLTPKTAFEINERFFEEFSEEHSGH